MSSSVCSVRAPIVVWRLFVPVIALFIVLVAALVGPGTAVATALGAPGGLYFTGALGFPAWLDQLSAMALGESPAVGTLTSGQVLTSLGLTVDPGQTGTGQTFTATVIALDQFGNEMVTMPPGGQVVNITIDGGATGPTQVTMLSGVSTFDITAVTEGQVTVTVNSGLMVSTAAVRVSNNAGTVVPGGSLGANTVWTAAGSPYRLTGDVTIPAGRSLTIQPGASVTATGTDGLAGGADVTRIELIVSSGGTLAAQGTTDSPVTCTGLIVAPASGSTAGLVHCVFVGGSIRPIAGGAVTLTDSRMLDLDAQMTLALPTADCRIERNIFRHAPTIQVSTNGSIRVYIQDNLFFASVGPIKNVAGPAPSATLVHGNTLMLPCAKRTTSLPNSAYLVLFASTASMDATSNYWPGAGWIPDIIYDKTDDAGAGGFIPYTPVRSGPAANTPLYDDSLLFTPTLGLSATTAVVPAGQKADLHVTVAIADSQISTVPVGIESSSDGIVWSSVSSTSCVKGATGTTLSVTPVGTTYYRAVVAKGYEIAAAVSHVVTVQGEITGVPTAVPHSYNATEDVQLVVAAPGVLAGCTAADTSTPHAYKVAAPLHGTVAVSLDGSFIYTPHGNYHGSDAFTYRVFDGADYSAPETVTLTIAAVDDVGLSGSPLIGELPGGSDILYFQMAPKDVLRMWVVDFSDPTLTAYVEWMDGGYAGNVAGRLNPSGGADSFKYVSPAGRDWYRILLWPGADNFAMYSIGYAIINDSTPPTTTLHPIGSLVTSANAEFTLSAKDEADGSGVSSVWYQLSGGPAVSYTDTVTVSLEGTYALKYSAVDLAGNPETTKTVSLVVDRTAPSQPSGLTTAAVAGGVVRLSWNPSSDSGAGVSHYRVWRDGSVVATTAATNYDFSGLVAGMSYTLGVSAVDSAGNGSSAGNVAVTVAIDTYTVSFNGNGGAPASTSATTIYNTALGAGKMPANPTRTGHTFAGWNTAANGSGTAFTSATLVPANVTVYAQWTLDYVPPTEQSTSITIQTSATSTSIGKTPILSGTVSPVGLIGKVIVVYVKKPGKSYWTYSSNRVVYSRYGVPAWQYKYFFKKGMAKGVYTYKAVVPAYAGFATSTSPTTVSIRVK
jgi:uncharacterized repeat protein (TIGR02543 family)